MASTQSTPQMNLNYDVYTSSTSHTMEKDQSLPQDKRNKVAQQFLIGQGAELKGSFAEMVFKAKSFEQATCQGLGPDDVHPEIIEWIVDAALYTKSKQTVQQGGAMEPFGQRKPEIELPDYDSYVFPKVWYDKKSYCPKDKDFFRRLYKDILANGKSSDISDLNVTKSTRDAFTLDVDGVVRHRMFQITNAPIVHGEPECDDNDGSFEMIDMLNAKAENIITRDRETKKLMRKNKDGKFVFVGEEDDDTKQLLRASHNCYGTGFKGDDKECKRLMFECLLSQDPASLQACLSDWANSGKSMFELAKDDIKNLHPVLALRILQQFGFRKYSVFDDEAGGQLYKVESVKHWLHNYMVKQFDQESVQKMFHDGKTNTILKYLDLVSQFVNANPAILNRDYTGSSAEAVGKQPVSDFAKKLGLAAYIPVPSRANISYDFNRLRGYLQTKPMRAPFQLTAAGAAFPGGPFMTMGGAGVGLLQGGGSKCEYMIKAFTQAGQVTGAQLMEHYVKSIVQDLEKKGKTLAPKDHDNIKEQLKKLSEAEQYLIRTLCYIDEYNRLLATLGDYSNKTVTLSEINACKFAERYNLLDGKYHNTENLLLEVIGKIQNLVKTDGRNFERINIEQ